MEIGMLGLGRMGGSMARRLLLGGHKVVVFSPEQLQVQEHVAYGAFGANSLEALVEALCPPRVVWMMIPAGPPVEETIGQLSDLLSVGDTIVDGGNSSYKDSMKRAHRLNKQGLSFLDVGTSGGIWGLEEGYSLMVGGEPEAFSRVEPIFQALAPAPDRGYGHVGQAGAGHFVKMVHNGVEYGLMEAYAEGFELMEAKKEFGLDLTQVGQIWRSGSVVRSWLLDLSVAALAQDVTLESLEPSVDDSGEGRWAVQEAIDLAVPMPVIAEALNARFRSRQKSAFSLRLLSALRNQFGGHAFKKKTLD